MSVITLNDPQMQFIAFKEHIFATVINLSVKTNYGIRCPFVCLSKEKTVEMKNYIMVDKYKI